MIYNNKMAAYVNLLRPKSTVFGNGRVMKLVQVFLTQSSGRKLPYISEQEINFVFRTNRFGGVSHAIEN